MTFLSLEPSIKVRGVFLEREYEKLDPVWILVEAFSYLLTDEFSETFSGKSITGGVYSSWKFLKWTPLSTVDIQLCVWVTKLVGNSAKTKTDETK